MWYVLHVQTGKESEIRKQLSHKGYTAYSPVEQRLIRSGGNWQDKSYTLFPGYLFICLDMDDEVYYRVKSTPGVIRFLGHESPVPLRETEEEYILLLCHKGHPVKPSKVRVLPDRSAVVVGGVLEKLRGRIVKIDKHSRKAIVEMNVCGNPKQIKLSVDIVEDQRKDAADAARLMRPGQRKPLK